MWLHATWSSVCESRLEVKLKIKKLPEGKGEEGVVEEGKGIKCMVMGEELTLGGEYTMHYIDEYYRDVHLKPINFINQCHPSKFN